MNRTIATLALVATAAIACSSTVEPARVVSAETAVQSAKAAGAESVPDANSHLVLAESELAVAKKFNSKGNRDAAEAFLSRAESDAALAAALSDEAKQKAKVESPIDRDSAKQPAVSP